MIAEVLDAGVVTVGAVAGLLGLAALGGAGYAGIKAAIGRLDEKVGDIAKAVVKIEKGATDHRHDDNDRFDDLGHRLGRIEFWHEKNGDFTPVRDTDKHRRVRPTDSGDSR